MKLKIINQEQKLSLLFVFLTLLGMLGCKQEKSGLQTPQWVKTTEVVEWKGVDTVIYSGKLKAVDHVRLAFQVPGPLKRVYVQEGERVKKGQLLAELDSRDYRLQFDAAQAEYVQVKEETDRIIELYRRGSVAVNEYDKAVAAQKRVKAQFQVAQNALNDTRLKAPFDGFIQHRYFVPPELVNQGTPVLSMQSDGQLEVEVELSARDFLRRSDFVAFSAATDVNPTFSFPLELSEIQKGANYNQLFKARFRLKESSPFDLSPGLSATVTIYFRPKQVQLVVVPISALFQRQDSSFVWRYDSLNQKVYATKVQVESVRRDGFARIKSTLLPGDIVVSAGVNDLQEGQRVQLLPPVSTSNVGGLL